MLTSARGRAKGFLLHPNLRAVSHSAGLLLCAPSILSCSRKTETSALVYETVLHVLDSHQGKQFLIRETRSPFSSQTSPCSSPPSRPLSRWWFRVSLGSVFERGIIAFPLLGLMGFVAREGRPPPPGLSDASGSKETSALPPY